jgi:RNA polymerase primary sigma factor
MRQLKIGKSITRDASSLDKYLQDISKLPMITVEEEIILASKIRHGDQQALNELVSANLRFVVSVAKQYQNQGISLQDLINEGNTGLIKAASRFDETRGFKFISYAVWWIRQCIIQAISEQSRIVRLPLNKIGALNKIRKVKGKLEQQLERNPTDAEIAIFMEIKESEVTTTRSNSPWHVSTDAALPGQEQITLMDVMFNADDFKPDHELMMDSLRIEIERVLSKLTEKEQDVIKLYFGVAGYQALTLDEIAIKFNLTRERVRQIKEKAIRKLRFKSQSQNLTGYFS